jgi:hypothetical protein
MTITTEPVRTELFLATPMLPTVTQFRCHTLYSLTALGLRIIFHASIVIHTTLVKSMTESQESEFARGGLNHPNSREKSAGVFINSEGDTRKLPKNRASCERIAYSASWARPPIWHLGHYSWGRALSAGRKQPFIRHLALFWKGLT